ncbi:MAG: competence/damage-inducible protein A [Deltaproteobacteria bacterium]|nr:competence/damage-inducible protein A [Deltaproteobacteria bacterium]
MKAYIIAVGKELLTGRVLDTNSNYIAKRLNGIGFRVAAIKVIDDEQDDIASALKESGKAKPRVLLFTGGLGPTPDDLTLRGIAKGLGKKLVKSAKALKFIKRRYEELYSEGMVDSPELNEFRAKMGLLPEGSRILDNHVGTAPGVHMREAGVNIFALPGVPAEMREMLEIEVMPRLEKIGGGRNRVEESIMVPCGDESVISGAIRKIGAAVPGVFIKPDPAGFYGSGTMKVYFSSYGPRERVEEAIKLMMNEFSKGKKTGGV